MAGASTPATRTARRSPFLHSLRTLRVIAGVDFQLKYSGSVLGYVWSVLKPLALFTMLYFIFGRVFRLGEISQYYPLSLLLGIVFFTFFADATSLGMYSILSRESLVRKLSFPRLIIPTSATLTAAMTFAVNCLVIVVFIAWNGITPRLTWLLLVPLLIQLYVLVLGVALILATVFVRLRDIGQVWELLLQLMFYGSPIIYPIGFLPPWARDLGFLSPFTQILQDARSLVLYADLPANRITADDAFRTGRLAPIGITIGILLLGLWLFRREEPWFAERV
ncbi:MAG: ABC transporter permease [Actinobacteria bacterium]|nr:ABC transporter permease [Actinomycetota bacterium]